MRWATKTSLFARMSLLFGLLVTLPLVISGIVLSVSGLRTIRESGRAVAAIGDQALDNTAESFRKVTREKLSAAGAALEKVAKDELARTTEEAVAAGKDVLSQNRGKMTEQGVRAVGQVTKRMVRLGQTTLKDSLKELRSLNQDSLSQLSSFFTEKMEEELRESPTTVKQNLQKTLLDSWETSADRRILNIQETATRIRFQVLLRLEYPLRAVGVVRLIPDDPNLKRLLEVHITKGFTPEIIRVVLVSSTGDEIVRVPDTDLQPGEEGEDWADSPTRTALFSQKDPALVEPVRFDERRKRWVLRIAHQVIGSEAGSESAPEAMAAAPVRRNPTPFVVVDVAFDSLVREAINDLLPTGMQILVIHAGTGRVVSSRVAREINQPANKILDLLPKGMEARQFLEKSFAFTYQSDDVRYLARARYWGENNDLWTVVAQPEAEVLRPVSELEAGIRVAWKTALERVNERGQGFIEKRSTLAEATQRGLIRDATLKMSAEERAARKQVEASFRRYELRLAGELEHGLRARIAALESRADQRMQKAVSALTRDAIHTVTRQSSLDTQAASERMLRNADRVANRAAGKMLLNSAWLIPLFLVLALFLATMTARSLVKPINQLVRGTQALAAGEYDRRIKVQGDDELARLAVAFNEMASAIERGQAELQQSHDSLAAEKARIEAVVNSSPDGLVMLQPTGEVAFINPAAIRLLHLPPAAIPPAPFRIAELPEPVARRLEECLERVRDSEGVQELELTEPQRRILQLRQVALRAAHGRSYGTLLHIHDITRERVIDEMKSDFISLVSHELRTPLTSILGFSSYMLSGRLGEVSENQRMALESIHRQAKRLSAIISDFLDISRIESGKIEMKKEPVQVAQVAERVIQDLRPQAAEKNIRMSTRVEDGAPPVAVGDEQRIAQVFTNLIGNALKFTDRDGSVEVHLARRNGEILCKVRDTGCGIPPDELDRVFDRFYQVEKVVTRKTGGTGLGLAIVKNIVEAHGGRIWIESEVGRGTEVSFTLPGLEETPAAEEPRRCPTA